MTIWVQHLDHRSLSICSILTMRTLQPHNVNDGWGKSPKTGLFLGNGQYSQITGHVVTNVGCFPISGWSGESWIFLTGCCRGFPWWHATVAGRFQYRSSAYGWWLPHHDRPPGWFADMVENCYNWIIGYPFLCDICVSVFGQIHV